MSDTGISVIVVNWNGRDDVVACLASLRAQTDPDFETILVDNGSTDGSVEHVRRDFAEVRVLETGTNLGFGEACNRGIEICDRPWIALLNNDAVADPRWIEELRAAARACGDDTGVIQARIMNRNTPDVVSSTGVTIDRDGTFQDRECGAKWDGREQIEEIFCASAGAALYRRAMIDAVRLPSGVFDRGFGMYFEDVDLGWRCRLAGWSAFLAPRAIVLHARHASSQRRGDRFVELQCRRNRIATLAKNASPRLMARTLPGTIRDLLVLLIRRGPASARDYLRTFRHGVAQRRAIEALTRVSRRDFERRWLSMRN